MTKFIECNGYVWKLSERSYKQLLKDIASNKDVDLDVVGKVVVDDQIKNLYQLQAKAKSNSWCRNILDGGEDND